MKNSDEASEKQQQILLVEDDPDHQELALLALEEFGLAKHTIVAGDGKTALELLSRDPLPKLVLLDLKLPGIGGLEVLRQLRGQARTRFTPVVILSSSDEDSDILRSYELGASSYIVKPVDFDNFAEAARVIGVYWVTLNRCPIPRTN